MCTIRDWLTYLPDIIQVGTVVVTIASIVTAATPTPDPATRLGRAYAILDTLAVNVGRAKDRGRL